MKFNPMTRRFFLQSSGSLVMALPFLESLLPRHALAQSASMQKNLILFFKPHGSYPEDYFPYNLYQPAPGLNVINRGGELREMRLSDIQGPISPIFGREFDAIRSRMNIYLGLSTSNNNHNAAIPFATDAKFPSIDQVISKSALFNKNGASTLAIHGTHGYDQPSSFEMVGGQVRPVKHVNDALVMFQRLFSDASSPATQQGMTQDQSFLLLVKDKKALDLVLDDYKQLAQNPALSATDKKIVTDYMDFMAQKQKMLADAIAKGPAMMPNPSLNKFPVKPDKAVNSDDITMTQTMIELMVAAIKTNTCNSFSFQLGCSVDETMFNIKNPSYNRAPFHQVISHNPGLRGDHLIVDQHLYGRLAQTFQMLSTPMTGDSTYADNTLIYASGDMGAGNPPFFHTSHSAIAVTLSGKNIPISTGRALAYASNPAGQGFPHNQLLIGLMESVGVSDWREVMAKAGINPGVGFGAYGGTQRAITDLEKQKAIPMLTV